MLAFSTSHDVESFGSAEALGPQPIDAPPAWLPFEEKRLDRLSVSIRCLDRRPTVDAGPMMDISPASAVKRRAVTWEGTTAEVVETTGRDRVEYRLRAPVHLLTVWDRGVRSAGETFVEGLPRSTLRDVSGKIGFVPAGHEFREWQEPRTPTRTIFTYFDPAHLPNFDLSTPRLFFEDAMILAAALSLRSIVESPTANDLSFLEVLGSLLAHELQRLDLASEAARPQLRGGLAAWQQRTVAAYIEEHLADAIPLAELARLARLSAYHFSRAFKQSFGVPPHRYHITRRIEHAKTLLLEPAMTVTEVGLTVGFCETSSFTATFHRLTGVTPTSFVRNNAERPD